MKRAAFAIALIAALALGCGKPGAQYVGSYSGEVDLPERMTQTLESMGMTKGEGENKAVVTLTLNADGTCTLVTDKKEGGSRQSGDWTYDGASKVITLNMTSPFLKEEDIQAMKKKGMTDEMIEKSTKLPMKSNPITDEKKLTFTSTFAGMERKLMFTRS